MPRKSAAVAEKPARKTRTPKATPEPIELPSLQVGDRVRITKAPRNVGQLATITAAGRESCYGKDFLIIADNETMAMSIMASGLEFVERLESTSEPAQFQVGDRVYYVQETNTGVIQELKGDQALVKLFLAASKPIWLGPVGLHPLTPDHITDPNSLQPGEMIKGQSLQGTEYQGKFTGWSMSGMAMLECLDGKKRMLAPATLVRIPVQVEESTEPEQFEEGRYCEGCKHGTVAPCAEGESVTCSLEKFGGAVMIGGPVSAAYAKSCSEFEEGTPPAKSDRVQEETNTAVQPNVGDRMDGLSLTGNYHSGVFVEVTTSGLYLIRKEDKTDVIITPDSARILEQQALPIELPTELPIAQLRTDGGTQPRAALDQDHIQELTAALTAGEKLPSVVAFYDGESYWLADGFHRLEAHSRANRETIPVEVKQGTQRDAILYAVGTNAAHGLKRSAADKRRAVLRLLEDTEWSQWADREIARLTKTSHPFVAKIRQEMPTNLVTFPDKRKFQRAGETLEMSVTPATPRPKDPIPSVDELHIMFSQIGTVKPAAKGTGFAVENSIGTPFPLAFKNRLQAWDWWQNHPEQIARLASGKGDYTPPLEPHPQTEITEDVRENLAEAGLQICRPSISPEEFNREMEKPLPLPNNAGDVPEGVCSMTDIPGGYRLDGLEMSSEVYLKLVGIARRYTKDMSLRGAIELLVNGFEMQEGA